MIMIRIMITKKVLINDNDKDNDHEKGVPRNKVMAVPRNKVMAVPRNKVMAVPIITTITVSK